MNSPLGKYGQIVAAVAALGLLGIWAFSECAHAFGAMSVAPEGLRTAALIALGAVFGSAATINGVKAPLDSAHKRIDKLEVGTGIQTHGSYVSEPADPASTR